MYQRSSKVPRTESTLGNHPSADAASAAGQHSTMAHTGTSGSALPTWSIPTQFQNWEVDHTRFQFKRMLGKGSYGSVGLAFDHKTGTRVAIKKIDNVFNIFENAKRIFREIRVLRFLGGHANVIKIVHLQRPNNLTTFKDLYVVFEALDTDMAKLCRDDTQDLTVAHVRWFMYQLLLSIKYTHSGGVIHRDIKPANILLTEACDLKMCDYGLARGVEGDAEADDLHHIERAGVSGAFTGPKPSLEESELKHHEGTGLGGGTGTGTGTAAAASATGTGTGTGTGHSFGAPPKPEGIHRQMTKHVVTRWYRAPELPLYNDGDYGPAIDTWSVGCCYAEMLGMLPTTDPRRRQDRRALFPGGSCYPMSRNRDGQKHLRGAARDQLNVIFDVLGTPDEATIERCRTEAAKTYIRSLPRKTGTPLASLYPSAPPEAIDLLQKLLAFHPEDRCTIDEALAHPFLSSVRRPKDEIEYKEWVPFKKIQKPTVRDDIVAEIRYYNPRTVPEKWTMSDGDDYDPKEHTFEHEKATGVATPSVTPSSDGPLAAGGSTTSEGKK